MFTFTKPGVIGSQPIAMIDGKLVYLSNGLGNSSVDYLNSISGETSIIPNPKIRQCMLIQGPSGAGKSTLATKYAMTFHKMFPKRDIFVISPSLSCDNYPKYCQRIDIDDLEDPLTLEETPENSLVIFDDIDTCAFKDKLYKFRDDLLERGRHKNIYVIALVHKTKCSNKLSSDTLLTECNLLGMFPKAGAIRANKRILENDVGLMTKDVRDIFDIPSRWIIIHKAYPQYIIHQGGIKAL